MNRLHKFFLSSSREFNNDFAKLEQAKQNLFNEIIKALKVEQLCNWLAKKLPLFFLLFPILSFAQAPVKGDNTIIITTADSADVAYDKLLILLEDNAYAIEKTDKDRLSVQTDKTPVKNSGITMYITGYIREDKIYLQGKYSFGGQLGVASYKGDIAKVCFILIDDLAKKYQDGKVSYLTKQ